MKLIWLILGFIALAYIAVVTLLYLFQKKLIFHPDKRSFEHCREINALGGQAKTLTFNNQELRYYEKQQPNSKAVLIQFHGNGGNACDRSFILDHYHEQKIHIVLAEYPGYANHAGELSQNSFLENALAIYDYFESTTNLPIFIWGESLGTGMATYIGSKRKAKGLILQSPYTSVAEVGAHHYRIFPVNSVVQHPFRANEWAKKVKASVIAFHSKKDEVIPFDIGKKQIENFSEIQFYPIESGLHSQWIHDSEFFWRKTSAFIETQLQ